MRFIAPWWRNGSFQRPQSFQFLNRSLFRSSPVVMSFRWRLKEYCQKNKWQRWDICNEFSVWHFVTKSTGLIKSCWLHPRESGPEVVQGPGSLTTSPTLLARVLVLTQGNQHCCWSWRKLGPPEVAAPATLPKGKVDTKMRQWMSM